MRPAWTPQPGARAGACAFTAQQPVRLRLRPAQCHRRAARSSRCSTPDAPGNALLVHGTLPPAHLRIEPWYRNRRLRKRTVAVQGAGPMRHRATPSRATCVELLPAECRLADLTALLSRCAGVTLRCTGHADPVDEPATLRVARRDCRRPVAWLHTTRARGGRLGVRHCS